MSKAVLITGYYRSGTSALSGTLSLAGVDIANTNEQNEHNPRGYFENPVLAHIDLELFRRLDHDWHDIRLMPEGWWQRPDVGAHTQRVFAQLKLRHGSSPLWGVKHPHLCRLLPMYEEAARQLTLAAPQIIHIYRNPWEVSHSQLKKNGLSRTHSLLLWCSYVLDGERYARSLDRVIVDYELLLKEPREVLERIGATLGLDFPKRSWQDMANIKRFITPQLHRSNTKGRESTPRPVHELADEVFEAALAGAPAERFDALRDRFVEQCALLDELAASRLSVTAAMSNGARRQRIEDARKPADTGEEPAGSPLRPSERTDVAERERFSAELAALEHVPTVGIVVAVPKGRVEAAFETARSIESQWHAPAWVRFVSADADAPKREDWIHAGEAPGELTEVLAGQLSGAQTDYSAVIDAGDRIEPDACARLALFVANEGEPALCYTDEIVARSQNPWIRHKPAFDVERERCLHYLGAWMWYRTAWLRAGGGLNGELFGAEDLDLALRAHDASQRVAHLPEALYARAMDSYRDAVSAELVRENSKRAVAAHLARDGIDKTVQLHDGVINASFVTRCLMHADKAVSLVLLCDDDDGSHANLLASARLVGIMRSLNLDHIVCAATGNAHQDVLDALTQLKQNNLLPDRLHVVVAPNEARMLKLAAELVGNDAVFLLSINASASDPNWFTHLQGKLFSEDADIGMVGARADFVAEDSTRRLCGPLLLGGGDGVGVIGLRRDANDPGPGGWLLAAQSVDGVAPPCVAIRGELFKALSMDETLAGAQLWLDLSMQAGVRHGKRVVWDPLVHFSCPSMPRYARFSGGDIIAANRVLRERWACMSTHHHPMLALNGDALSPLASPGLCAPAPRTKPVALLSGDMKRAEYAIEWLRAARMKGEMTAGWAAEPIAVTEMRRLAPQAWLRVNPPSAIESPDAPTWYALFTYPPAPSAQLKRIGEQAARSFATSPMLAEALRKRSYNRLQPEVVVPKLPARLWRELSSTGSVGRHNLRVLWVDEGDPPDWMVQLLNEREVQWFVVHGDERHYDGPIATYKRPENEDEWSELMQRISPHVLIRPANEATWMDCQLLLRGAAVGAALYADPRLHVPGGLPVTAVKARLDDWQKAVRRMLASPEEMIEAGRQARAGLEALGWLEDEQLTESLLWAEPVAALGCAA